MFTIHVCTYKLTIKVYNNVKKINKSKKKKEEETCQSTCNFFRFSLD